MRRLWLLFACVLSLGVLSTPASANHNPSVAFAGNWSLTSIGGPVGTLSFRVIPAESGPASMRAIKDVDLTNLCPEQSWYAGTFAVGGDSGQLVGCTENNGRSIYVQYTSASGPGFFFASLDAAGAAYSGKSYLFETGLVGGITGAFQGHFEGDGSGEAVQENLCGGRAPAAAEGQPKQAVCKLDRVVFLDGTNAVQGVASSKRAVVGQRVYFLARVTSAVVPADLVLLFPKEVAGSDIEVVSEAKASGLGCTQPSKLRTGTHAGKSYIVCTIDKSKSRLVVGVIVPKALSNKPLDVLLLVGKPKAAGQAREWIAKQTLAVDVDIEIVLPKPAASQPAAARDPIEGHWVGFVPKPGRDLPGVLKPFDPPPFFADADLRITKAQDVNRLYNDIFTTLRGSFGEIYLNEPKSEVYKSGAVSLIYEGSLARSGVQLKAGRGDAVQLELIRPGTRVVKSPELCLGVAEQAKAPILCGLVEGKRMVLRRVSD
jgi:hypothetical protein